MSRMHQRFGCLRSVPGHTAILFFAVPLLLLAGGVSGASAQAPEASSRAAVERAAREAMGKLELSPAQRAAWAKWSAEARERRSAALALACITPGESASARMVPLSAVVAAELRAITEWHRARVLELLNEEQRRAWIAGRGRAAALLVPAPDSLSPGSRP